MKAIEQLGAFCVIVAVLAWGCSGSGDGPKGQTGGNSGTGGSGASCAFSSGCTTGGTSGSGGVSGTGGTSGSDATGATGGTSGTGQKPFSCNGWTRDQGFPKNLDLTYDIWGSSASDIYVATGNYSTGEIAHYDGANWSLMTLPAVSGESWSGMYAVWGSSSSDVWAGGATKGQFTNPEAKLLRRQGGGGWVVDSSLPTVSGDRFVRSIWGADANNVFVLVDYVPPYSWDSKIFRKNGSSWSQMTLPPHSPPIMIRNIWGKSASDVYAVGTVSTALDAGENSVKGALWHYDGNGNESWKDIATLPADVLHLMDVGGAGNEIVVVGQYRDGSDYWFGVRLMSTDLVNWSRYNSIVTEIEMNVWCPWQGACLTTAGSNPVVAGSARIGVLSLGSWTESQIDNWVSRLTAIWAVPGSTQVWLAGYDQSGTAGVYKGACQ